MRDVGIDDQRLAALPRGERELESGHDLHQHPGHAVRPVVDQQVAAVDDVVVALQAQVSERVALFVGAHVAACLRWTVRARLLQNRTDATLVEIRLDRLLLALTAREQQEP
jgi:hypothetical protein